MMLGKNNSLADIYFSYLTVKKSLAAFDFSGQYDRDNKNMLEDTCTNFSQEY
jgi:hypothetical protein